MPFVLDTTSVDESDRPDFVRVALGMTIVPIELHWPENRREVSARGVIADFGELTVCSGRTTAWKVERTTKLAKDSMEPSVFVNLQHFGSGMVVQHGREAVSRPGDLVMYDSTAPYTLVNETGVTGDFIRVPHSALALPHDVIRDACAVRLAPGHPVAALTHDFLSRLPALAATPDSGLVGHPSIELIRALIVTHAGGGFPVAEAPESIQARVLEYASAHLHDPGLSPEMIAAANHISVRYLYKLLAKSGISLARWIQVRRLEACRQALAKCGATTAISSVARLHGFSDMSSFSRSFRAEFGTTPREWRDREATSS